MSEEVRPASAQITAALARRITSGDLRPGERVPSTREIVRDWGVAMATASKALAALKQEGLTEVKLGVGTVVSHGYNARAGRPRSQHPRAMPHRSPGSDEAEAFLDQIVQTATAIADADGLGAATMRRIATDLDVATMALYRHVRGKDHLVALMADAAFADYSLPAQPADDWRTELDVICRTQWAMYRRHPWLAHVVSLTRPLLTPHAMAHTESTMRALAGQHLDPTTLIHTAATVANFVRGTAINLQREAEARQDTGLTGDEWMRTQTDTLAAALGAGSFPILAAISARYDIELSLDTLFEFGLQRTLDGIAALCLSSPTGQSRPSRAPAPATAHPPG